MSVWSFEVGTITPGAGTADGSALTTLTFMAIQGGAAGQASFVDEVYMGGQASSTAPLIMLLGRDSTVMVTPTALSSPNSFGPPNPSAGVLTAPAVGAITSGTLPQRSNSVSLSKKNFTFNAYGGIVRANYANTSDRFGIIGTVASLGELSLSSFTGSTASAPIGAHILIETM